MPNAASARPRLGSEPRRFVNSVVEYRAAKADGPSAIAASPRAQGRFTRGSRRSCTPHSAPSPPPPAPLGRQPGTEQLSHGRPATRVALQAPNWPPAQPMAERRGGGTQEGEDGGSQLGQGANPNPVSQSESAVREGESLSDFLVNGDWPAPARFNQLDETGERMATQKSYAAGSAWRASLTAHPSLG